MPTVGDTDHQAERRARRYAVALAVSAGLAGAAIRIWGGWASVLWGDEFHVLLDRRLSDLTTVLTTYDDRGTGIGFPLAQYLSLAALGPTLLGLRLPAVLAGILGPALAFWAGRPLVGASAAAIAAAALALSPLHVFYSTFGRGYSLVCMLGLVLGGACARGIESRRDGWWLLVAGVGGALIYVHLTSVALLAAGFVGSSLAARNDLRLVLVRILPAFGTAAALGAALHVPAWDGLAAFWEAKAGGGMSGGGFSPLDVATLIGGSEAGAWIWLLALPAAAVAFARCGGSPIVLALAFVPVVILGVVNPISNAPAFARYLIGILPWGWMLVGWGVVALVNRTRRPNAEQAALALGGVAVAAMVWASPIASAARVAPYGATYLGMYSTGVFDHPLPGDRRFYGSLGAESAVGVIQFPPVRLGGALVYRAGRLALGRPTWMGYVGHPPAGIHGAPLVAVDGQGPPPCDRGEVLLILYRNLTWEIRSFQNASSAAVTNAIDRPFIRLPPVEAPLEASTVGALRARWGEPAHETRRHIVWRISCDSSGWGVGGEPG